MSFKRRLTFQNLLNRTKDNNLNAKCDREEKEDNVIHSMEELQKMHLDRTCYSIICKLIVAFVKTITIIFYSENKAQPVVVDDTIHMMTEIENFTRPLHMICV